jgi:hypothetical protein
MGYDIQWNLLGAPVDVAGRMWKSFEEGRALRDKHDTRKFASAFAADPTDQKARTRLYGLNPTLAAGIEDQAYEQSERKRAAEFRGAYGEHLLERTQRQPVNALGGPPGPASLRQPGAFGAAPEAVPAQGSALSAFAPAAAPARPTAENALLPPMSAQPLLAEPAMAPPPSSSFERMVRADPEKFLTFEGKRLDIDAARLKQMLSLSNAQMQLLGGVHDDASLQRAKEQARQLARQFNFPTDSVDAVPDTYTPELVRSLQMQGMDTQKQLIQVVRENKLDWDIEDDQEDNERADLEAGSRIDYREGSLADRRERTRIARERPRPAARGSAARAPTKATVVGRLIDKQARGQKLTPQEQAVLDTHGSTKGGETYTEGTVIEMPDGTTKVRRGGKWVKE